MMNKARSEQLAVCVQNRGYEASLELGKMYRILSDREAEADGFARAIDESGEDYLFPSEFFEPVSLRPSVRRRVFRALRTLSRRTRGPRRPCAAVRG